MPLTLFVLPGRFAICRLAASEAIPDWADLKPSTPGWAAGRFASVTRTADELSIVAPEDSVPESVRGDRGWRVLKVEGPLDLTLTGVLASLASPLAEARINIFAVSTFDTDYLLVKNDKLLDAVDSLRRAGHRIEPGINPRSGR